jgi:hypothetical protein
VYKRPFNRLTRILKINKYTVPLGTKTPSSEGGHKIYTTHKIANE